MYWQDPEKYHALFQWLINFLTTTDNTKHCGFVWAVFYCVLNEAQRLNLTLEQPMKT